jgi:hypothetical protein
LVLSDGLFLGLPHHEMKYYFIERYIVYFYDALQSFI